MYQAKSNELGIKWEFFFFFEKIIILKRFQCDWFAKSVLGLTTSQHAMRSLMTLALTFGNVSIFPALLSLDCVNLPGVGPYLKSFFGIFTGFLQLFTGKV